MAEGVSFVLPMRFGSMVMDMALERFASADALPADKSVCYADKGDGRLVVAIYKRGRWLNRHEKPLGFEPEHWFKLGGKP
jgi:hypothetical protein